MRRLNQSSDDVELPSHIKLPILEMEKIEKVEAALKNKQTRYRLAICARNKY